jgi:hypothetical protein
LKGNEGQGLGYTNAELEPFEELNDSTAAEDFIYKQASLFPREVVVCCIGMMTNIGKACQRHGDFSDLVGHVVLMGGGGFVDAKYAVFFFFFFFFLFFFLFFFFLFFFCCFNLVDSRTSECRVVLTS